jgi:ribosomal protein S27AE
VSAAISDEQPTNEVFMLNDINKWAVLVLRQIDDKIALAEEDACDRCGHRLHARIHCGTCGSFDHPFKFKGIDYTTLGDGSCRPRDSVADPALRCIKAAIEECRSCLALDAADIDSDHHVAKRVLEVICRQWEVTR